MALHLKSTQATIAVISRKDDALPADLKDSEWEAYSASLDEAHLRLAGEPTRFVLKTELGYAAQQSIQSMQMGINEEGKPEVRLGFILEVIRCALCGIENPASLPVEQHIIFKKDRDANASKELISMLHNHGIVMELYGIRESAIQRMAATPTKK